MKVGLLTLFAAVYYDAWWLMKHNKDIWDFCHLRSVHLRLVSLAETILYQWTSRSANACSLSQRYGA